MGDKSELLLLCAHEVYNVAGNPVINAIKTNLNNSFNITTWMDNVIFPPVDTRSSIERFLQSLYSFDGVIILMTGEDLRMTGNLANLPKLNFFLPKNRGKNKHNGFRNYRHRVFTAPVKAFCAGGDIKQGVGAEAFKAAGVQGVAKRDRRAVSRTCSTCGLPRWAVHVSYGQEDQVHYGGPGQEG